MIRTAEGVPPMSLFSYMNLTGSTSSSTSSGLGSLYGSALEQLTATVSSSAAAKAGSSSTSSSGVTISAEATIAAAAKADKDKDGATLTADIRKDLDAQYAKSGKTTPDLSAQSPRALATIILNESGSFSKSEVLHAKAELRSRDRATFLAATANDFSLSSLEAYQTAKLTSRSAMSVEERTVRDAGNGF
ncbi:hypothetical protein BH10PSE13_BH10PSE13_08650 [soil metagenome]